MSVQRRWGIWLLGLGGVWIAVALQAAPRPARPADELVQSIGVNTRWDLPDSPYIKQYDEVKQLLKDLKIRHVRDTSHRRIANLFVDLGISSAYVATVPLEIEPLKQNAGALWAIEGMNQSDVQRVHYGGSGFPESTLSFQEELYDAVKNDNDLVQLPVVAPTMALAESLEYLVGLQAFDMLASPPFLGALGPARVGEPVRRVRALLQTPQKPLPIVLTEAGYHTAPGLDFGPPGLSERAQAKYLPRMLARAFEEGVARTYLYQLLDTAADPDKTDPEANYGLIRHDLSPKPAYFAIQNLIQILEDPGPAHPQRALDFEFTGDTESLRHLLLQKRDGVFYLLLWNDLPAFNQFREHEGYGQDVNNEDSEVTLKFGPLIREASVYRPVVGSSPARRLELPKTQPQSVTVEVPDEMVIVKIVPVVNAGKAPPGAPTNLSISAEGTTATLNWIKPTKGPVAGYLVWRDGRFVGQTTETTFTDRAMSPETTHTYQVAAHDEAGNISDQTRQNATAGQSHPDLVITDISWYPKRPRAGRDVRLSAVVKNVGSTASPGVVHGVRFEVGEQTVNWSEDSTEPLETGAIRRISATAGLARGKLWRPSEEPVEITAIVDPDNQIAETDEENNRFSKTFPGVPPGRRGR